MAIPFIVPAAIALALYFLHGEDKAPGVAPNSDPENKKKVKKNKSVEITRSPIDDPANPVPDCTATKPENNVPTGGDIEPSPPSES